MFPITGWRVGYSAMHHLPPAANVHPNVGETITVFVSFTLLGALFVVRTSDHNCIAVHSNLKVRHFCTRQSRFHQRRIVDEMPLEESLGFHDRTLGN
jgi:hypothetical protein